MKRSPLLRTAQKFAVGLLAAGTAQAAIAAISVDMQLGPTRPIAAESIQFGAGVAISNAGGRREVGIPNVSEILWTQRANTTYPLLLRNTLNGTITESAKIALTQPGFNKPYLTLSAGRAGLTGLSLASDSVAASIAFDTIKMEYDPAGVGKVGSSGFTTYDLDKDLTTTNPGSGYDLVPVATPASASNGDTVMYMRLGSGSKAIQGESTAIGYEQWTRIDHAQMGVGMTFNGAGTGAKVAGTPSISELTFGQQFDSTITYAFAALLQRVDIGQVTIEYVTDRGAGPVTFMQLALDNVMLSGLSLSSGGELPSITGSLNFTGFSQTVWDIGADGTRRGSTSVGFDLMKPEKEATSGSLAADVAGFGTGNLSGAPAAAGGGSGPGPAPVPEPGTWMMMFAGLGVLALAARRRVAA